MAGQSINDRILAARLSIAGQGLAKSVCKATTEEAIGPKKKHLDYLLHCTNEPNVSIPQLANLLIERTNNASWVVVFKALVTVHHLMCYGNERFTQYLASSNCNFQLSSFLDKTGVQVGYDMSTFIRRYAKYLNEKALSYRIAAFDFCKVKRGSKEDGILRTMNAEKLVKTLPVLQNQIDALLEFDCTANELTNGVINTAFMLLFRDLIRLFACYNDGIINLLEKYFDMNKKMARDALDIYKKFLIRMDRVAEFLKVAENVGIDKGDIPDLTKAPSSLLDALEQHLATLEGKKGGGATTPTQPTSGRQTSVKNAVLALSNTSSAFGSAAASSVGPRQSVNGGGNDDDPLRKLALEEEEAILELHRERRIKELAGQSPTSERNALSGLGTNPFLSSPTGGGDTSGDLFGSLVGSGGGHPAATSKTSDDLLCLAGNPFSGEPTSTVGSTGGGGGNVAAGTAPPAFWSDHNGLSSGSAFVAESSFAAVFGGNTSNRPAVASTHGITIAEMESEKSNCDLTIPGLNPFANIVTTPSPSAGPYEFGGPGTTPILGGSEAAAHVSFAAFSGDHSSEHEVRGGIGGIGGGGGGGGGGSRSASPCPIQFDAAFEQHRLTPSKVPPPRPPSPAPGTMAPKPTPVSSPAPASFMSRHHDPSSNVVTAAAAAAATADVFGDFPFGAGVAAGGPTSAPSPPPEPQPLSNVAFPSSPAQSKTSASAFDDLNATVKAVFGEAGKGPFIPTTQSSVSAVPPPSSGPLPGFQSPGRQQAFGFGSPSKIVPEFDAFGDILQPVPSSGVPLGGSSASSSGPTSKQGASKVITGDLDSSLASLVQNLEINRASGGLTKSGHVWNSPRNTAKTGGANWSPNMAGVGGGGGGGGGGAGGTSGGALWSSPQHGAAYQPMGGGGGGGGGGAGGATTAGRPADWSSGLMGGHFPPASVQQFTGTAPTVVGVAQGPPAMLSKGFPAMARPQPNNHQQQQQQQQQQQTTLDPFGAL